MSGTSITLSVLLLSLLSFPAAAAEDAPHDAQLAAKYGLTIPPADDASAAPPEWLQKADMFVSTRDVWKGYDIELKDVLVERIVRYRAGHARKQVHVQEPAVIDGKLDGSLVKGVALISHAPHSRAAYRQAHEQGFRAVPYVHFMCIHTYYADQDVFYFQHPEILLKDSEGRWVHTPMDGSDRLHRILTCANSPSYWKLSLAYVKKMMDLGADGVFIDNVSRRQPCHAHKFRTRNPEFDAYVHEHLFPDASHDHAWSRLLQAIRALVKSYGDDKIVILNPGLGDPFQNHGDCCMWESFIYSWAWDGRRHTWAQVKRRAKDNHAYLESGRRITALSYLDRSRKEVKEDAYWAFSAARLVDFIWWAALDGSGAEALYRAHMGKALEPIQEDARVAHRTFENGLIVLNDSEEERDVQCTLAHGFHGEHLLDLFDGTRTLDVQNGRLALTVPANSARVYMVTRSVSEGE
jgi:hypothetical protein